MHRKAPIKHIILEQIGLFIWIKQSQKNKFLTGGKDSNGGFQSLYKVNYLSTFPLIYAVKWNLDSEIMLIL